MTTNLMHCERCGAILDDSDIRSNTIELPHSGYYCLRCCGLYFEQAPTFKVQTLRTRYGTDIQDWEIKERTLEAAENVARIAHATEINCYVGEISVFQEMLEQAA